MFVYSITFIKGIFDFKFYNLQFIGLFILQ